MRKKLIEESVLFVSILKWFVLATAVGALVGAATALFIGILSWSARTVSRQTSYFLLLPRGLLLRSAIVRYVEPDAPG